MIWYANLVTRHCFIHSVTVLLILGVCYIIMSLVYKEVLVLLFHSLQFDFILFQYYMGVRIFSSYSCKWERMGLEVKHLKSLSCATPASHFHKAAHLLHLIVLRNKIQGSLLTTVLTASKTQSRSHS